MKAIIAVPVFIVVVIVDFITKAVAVATMVTAGAPRPVIGDWVRFALVYNPGAAFGLHLGPYSRWLFMALTVVALFVLWRLYRSATDNEVPKVLAVALVASGAVGNVIDRMRSELGVVDFIDVGVGAHRWPTFNVADMAVSTGAILLAWVLWQEERRAEALHAQQQAQQNASSSSTGAL